MALDIKTHRKKIKGNKPMINLVPLIDILFTLLIFVVVTSTFSSTAIEDAGTATGKPNATDTSGDAEYFSIPVANLEKVIVNGQDMSSMIRNHAIGVHSRVIDEGEINIRPRDRVIIITAPPGMSPEQAVHPPE